MKSLLRSLLFALSLASFALPATAGSFGGEVPLSSSSVGSQFPEVAYYAGVIHVVWVGYAPGLQGDIYYSRSSNSGVSFSAPLNLSANATASSGNDRPQVTAGAKGVFVGWNSDNNSGAIYVRRSSDGGLNFASTTLVAGVEGGFYSRITNLFTDSLGNIHLGYFTNGDTNGISGMIHHRMTCDGTTWGTDTAVTGQVVDGDVDNEEPRLGESGGKLYVVFRSSRNGNFQGGWPPYTIYMQTGTVSGCAATWSYPGRRIAGGIPLNYGSTWRPEVFGDSTGMVHLAWWAITKGANVFYRRGNPSTGTFSGLVMMSNFGIDHLEPGSLSSTPTAAAGGYQAPPGLVSNGTTAFMAYQRNFMANAQNVEIGPIYLRESADNGVSWGAEQSIATSGNAANTPRIALGGTGNQNVAIVWSDARGGTARIYHRLYSLGAISGGPVFSLTPDTVSLGNVAVSSTSPTALTLVNSGTAGNISSITGSGNFAIGGGSCAAGALAGGTSCSIVVNFTPTALGARTGTVTVSTDAAAGPSVTQLDGVGIGSSSFNANVSAVVTGYYETILGRSPDAAGLAFWISEANRVVSLGADVREVFFAMSIDFFNSQEYRNRNTNNTQYLTDLYRTFFQRQPDQAGLNFYLGFLSQGMDRGAVLTNFLFSTEFSNQMTSLFGVSNPRPEINVTIDLYRGIFGRLPDSAGFNFYLGRVRTAQCQGTLAVQTEINNLAAFFLGSPEYGNIDTARAPAERTPRHVGDLYNAFLRRGADLAGYLFYVGQLTSGAQTRDQVRLAFVQSPEFQNRLNAVIAAGCLPGF